MKQIKFKSSDFDFEGFFDTIVAFIEENFGSDSPDAAETMRYFYSFEQASGKDKAPFTAKDAEEWEMKDFKDAILKGGVTIFFPFSSGLDLDGSVSLASGGTVQLSGDDEAEGDVPSIGETDCYGFFLNLEKGKFKFDSAIAFGGIWFRELNQTPTRELIRNE